jgi:hypothetical protein
MGSVQVSLSTNTQQPTSETKTELKYAELKTHWGFDVAELEKHPELSKPGLPKVQKLRAIIYKLVELAGDTEFSLTKLSPEKRREIIRLISADQIMQTLKYIGAIGPENQDLSHLNASEQEKLKKLYTNGGLEKLLVPYQTLTPKKRAWLALLTEVDLKTDPRAIELKDHWGIGVAELEERPYLIRLNLTKVKMVRALIYKIAKLSGGNESALTKLSPEKRRELITSLTPEHIMQSLKDIGAISPENQDLLHLGDSDQKKLAHLYKNGGLEELLVPPSELNPERRERLALLMTDNPAVAKLAADPKFIELNEHWGIGAAEIKERPHLLNSGLPKLQKHRALLYKIAELAGDTQFSLTKLSPEKRRALIMSIPPEQIIQNLQAIGAISPEHQDLLHLNASEQTNIKNIYTGGGLEDLLVSRNDLSLKSHRKLARLLDGKSADLTCEIEFLLKKLHLPRSRM